MNGREGYSLIEVLIAFVIMTLVLAALIPGQAALLSRATVLEEQVLAHDYALSRAARLGVDTPLVAGTARETYRDWQIDTEIIEGGMIRSEVETLVATITVTDLGGRQLASYQTLRVTP